MNVINPNPKINSTIEYDSEFLLKRNEEEKNDEIEDVLDKYEIFDIIRNIYDPEHPLTLEQINVVNLDDIFIDNENKIITVYYTPTIPNCTLSSGIGLSIKVKLLNTIDKLYKIDVLVKPGTQELEDNVNKQLCDKERVYATLEGENMLKFLGNCIKNEKEWEKVYE